MNKTFRLKVELKHKNLIETLKLSGTCPPIELQSLEIEAYRWVHAPINNDLNFNPNYIYDHKNGGESIYTNERLEDKQWLCGRCGQSFFNNKSKAIAAFSKLSGLVRNKLGYTHLANGQINVNDGLASEVSNNGHFSFYEYEGCDFRMKFQIIGELE